MDDNTPPEVKALIDDVVRRMPLGGENYAYGLFATWFTGNGLAVASMLNPIGVATAVGVGIATTYITADKRTKEEKEEELKKFTLDVFYKMQSYGRIDIDRSIQKSTLVRFFDSSKLADLEPNTVKRLIANIPMNDHDPHHEHPEPTADKYILTALINNINLDRLLPDNYDTIYEKINEMDSFNITNIRPFAKERLLKEFLNQDAVKIYLENKDDYDTDNITEKKILFALNYPKEYKKRVLEVEAKLSTSYQRHGTIKAFIDDLNISKPLIIVATPFVAKIPLGTILIEGVVHSVGKGVKKLINQQIPDDEKPTQTEINAEIAKIETPLQRLNAILPELTADNIASVSDNTLARFFDTCAAMAANGAFDIDNRLKPMVKLLEIMPDDKFDNNSVVNHERIFIVTDLIKNTLDLKRGDIATDLMTHFIPKINNNNPELMRDTSELSNSFRQTLSDITQKSVEFTRINQSLNPTDKRKPLETLLAFTTDNTIPEYRISDDPTEPMDIPVTGHLPEIINSTIADLRNNQTEILQSLIKHASKNDPDHIVTGTDIFNGQDKKILGVMLDTLKRAIDPNPLNEAMSDFLTLYTAGHFAEGGGFSDTANDGQTHPLRVLDRLVDTVKTQTRYNDEPTILEHLNDKPAENNEITSFNPNNNNNECDFKKAYRTNGDINRMKTLFNQYSPKPFKTSITANMAKHRIFGG